LYRYITREDLSVSKIYVECVVKAQVPSIVRRMALSYTFRTLKMGVLYYQIKLLPITHYEYKRRAVSLPYNLFDEQEWTIRIYSTRCFTK